MISHCNQTKTAPVLSKTIKVTLLLTFCQMATPTIQAQLCTGSLGDPIININFGSGTSLIGPALPKWITNYGYESNNGPSDGNYTITQTGSNGVGGSWHALTSDHTGNPKGYFMLVNASNDPGFFYKDTIRGLCSNTTYEFAAWLINLLKTNNICGPAAIKPNITFRIEKTNGAILQSFNTGDLPETNSIQWKQYGFFFTTQPNMQTVVIRMINNAPGGCGNDLAIDDITFRPCGRQLNTFVTGSSATTLQICPGKDTSIQLSSALSSGSGTPVYQWQESRDTGASWTDIPNATTGTYRLPVRSNQAPGQWLYRLSLGQTGATATTCRTTSNIITLTITPPPRLSVSGTHSVCTGQQLIITATTTGSLQWKGPGLFTSTQPSIIIDSATSAQTGRYYATILFDNGCSYTDSSFTATVYPLPLITASAPSGICSGSSFTLSATANTPLQWRGPAGFTSTQSPVTIQNATPANAGKYYATTLSDKGCSNTDSSIIIEIYPLPDIVVQGPPEVCTGTAFSITANTAGSVQWKGPGGLNATQPAVHIDSAGKANEGKYYATTVSGKGCRQTDSSLTIAVIPLPTVAVSGPDEICTGARLTLTATASAPVQWKGPDHFAATQDVATIPAATTANQGRYYATASSDKGCRKTDSSLVVSVFPLPATNTNKTVEICFPETAQLKADGGERYQWTPAISLSDAHSNQPTASPAVTTTYYVTVSDRHGCTGKDSVKVIVNNLPVADAGPDKEIAEGQSTILYGNNNGSPTTWYWTPDRYISDNRSLHPSVYPPSDTIYVLHITNQCGTATDSVLVKVFHSIDAPNAFSPNGDGIHDTWEIPALQAYPQAEVQVFGRYGMRVFYSKGYAHPWNGSYNNKPLPTGTYYYLIDLKDNKTKISGSVTIL